jgi:hypothetical protein
MGLRLSFKDKDKYDTEQVYFRQIIALGLLLLLVIIVPDIEIVMIAIINILFLLIISFTCFRTKVKLTRIINDISNRSLD